MIVRPRTRRARGATNSCRPWRAIDPWSLRTAGSACSASTLASWLSGPLRANGALSWGAVVMLKLPRRLEDFAHRARVMPCCDVRMRTLLVLYLNGYAFQLNSVLSAGVATRSARQGSAPRRAATHHPHRAVSIPGIDNTGLSPALLCTPSAVRRVRKLQKVNANFLLPDRCLPSRHARDSCNK